MKPKYRQVPHYSERNKRPRPPKPPVNQKLTGKGHNAPSPVATSPTFTASQASNVLNVANIVIGAPVFTGPIFAEISGLPPKPEPPQPPVNVKLTAVNYISPRPIITTPAFDVTFIPQFAIAGILLTPQFTKPSLARSLQ
jgi:hypothetical protein